MNLTRSQILAADERQLDELAVLLMGWKRVDAPHHIKSMDEYCVRDDGVRVLLNPQWEYLKFWRPSSDRDAAAQVVAKMASKSLVHRFVCTLDAVIGGYAEDEDDVEIKPEYFVEDIFAMLNASPKTIVQAALIAAGVEK